MKSREDILQDQELRKSQIFKSFLLEKGEKLKGGDADNMTLEDIATFWSEKLKRPYKKVLKKLKKQFDMGLEEEKEHSSDRKVREEIILDHLVKSYDYYTKLKKVED